MIAVVSITLETNNARNRLVTHGPSAAKTINHVEVEWTTYCFIDTERTYVLFDDRH